ncbi:hypothetical protein P154DRAFT_95024 [Amniculicola lignicola CBS 123094]|uniref:Uncharacterized protein n=1 Tax=Amniculicola lignicola CBS 123094 TaxID=1392246 RepID=A0A6A5WRY1_9PLEO|nr:hypothetical protein P154DRAFT_95024 [Amniculicola lignicola CBS 123094]
MANTITPENPSAHGAGPHGQTEIINLGKSEGQRSFHWRQDRGQWTAAVSFTCLVSLLSLLTVSTASETSTERPGLKRPLSDGLCDTITTTGPDTNNPTFLDLARWQLPDDHTLVELLSASIGTDG